MIRHPRISEPKLVSAPASAAPAKRSLWKELEEMGLEEVVMVERIKALRALDNARGGALSRKKRPPQPALRELGKVLRDVLEQAANE